MLLEFLLTGEDATRKIVVDDTTHDIYLTNLAAADMIGTNFDDYRTKWKPAKDGLPILDELTYRGALLMENEICEDCGIVFSDKEFPCPECESECEPERCENCPGDCSDCCLAPGYEL